MATTRKRRPTAPTFGEVAFTTGGRDITRGFSDSLLQQPSDRVLQARGGGDFKIYEEVRRDDQVKATFQQRRLAVVSREWAIEPGGTRAIDKKAADALRENINELPWDQISEKMLFGIFYGYAVGEAMWERDGRQIVLTDVKVRRRQRFRWDRDGRLRLLTASNFHGEIMPERKFWTFSTGSDHDDDPYGLGLAHWLFWPVFFKRNGIKFWLIFLDKFGGPTAVGKFPPSALDEDKEKLLAAVNAIQTDAGIIIPEGMMIDLLEATRSGSADQAAFYDKMDGAISKVVLSQTMTTDDGSSRAQASVHFDVRQEVVKADADLLSSSFNCGPAQWLTDWNFPGAKAPRVWRRTEDDPDLKEVAERDNKIFSMGYEPTQEYIDETYGEGFVKKPGTSPPADPSITGDNPPRVSEDDEEGDGFSERCPSCGSNHHSASFADPDGTGDSLNDLVRDVLADETWVPLVEPAMAPIEKLLDDAESLQEVRDRVASTIADMATEQFQELLARSGFASRLAGETGAPTSDRDDEDDPA